MSDAPSDRLRQSWRAAWRDLWRPLLQSRSAPEDLVIELLRKAAEETRPSARDPRDPHKPRNGRFLTSECLNRLDLDLDLNSENAAKAAFRSLRANDFRSSTSMSRFLEAAMDILGEFEEPELTQRYGTLVRKFLVKYNLPYSFGGQPIRLRVRLPGAIEMAYSALERCAATDQHLGEALDGFGRAWSDFFEADQPQDLKSAIEKASKLAEAYAARSTGVNGSLGDLVDRLRHANAFPHAGLGEAVKKIYGFCCNYPHIRHAGEPRAQLRELQRRDVIFVSMFLVAFAAYANDLTE